MPPIVGAAVGSLFAALNRYGVVRFWRAPSAPLRVVITGSTKGIGKALAREFLRCAIFSWGGPLLVRKSLAWCIAVTGPFIMQAEHAVYSMSLAQEPDWHALWSL